jgi:membrane-associated protease RseP (regulator of RpoE activity)
MIIPPVLAPPLGRLGSLARRAAVAAAVLFGIAIAVAGAGAAPRARSGIAHAARAFTKDPRPIVARDVFCSGRGAAESPSLAREVALLATMVVPRDPRESRALVASTIDPARPPSMVGPGDRLLDTGAAVIAIAPRRIIVRRDGGPLEVLRIDPSAVRARAPSRGVDCAAPGRCTIDRALVARALADPRILRGVRALPAMRDGRPVGWRIFGVEAESPVAALGLANGDVIVAVDGTPVPTLDALLGVSPRLRDAARVTLTIERASVTRSLEVTLR